MKKLASRIISIWNIHSNHELKEAILINIKKKTMPQIDKIYFFFFLAMSIFDKYLSFFFYSISHPNGTKSINPFIFHAHSSSNHTLDCNFSRQNHNCHFELFSHKNLLKKQQKNGIIFLSTKKKKKKNISNE